MPQRNRLPDDDPLFRHLHSRKQPGLSVAGLFAGIGGLELGLARAGHRTEMLCEIDVGAQAVLRAHMPELPLHADIRTLTSLPKETNLVVGGFPCQDLSQAGKAIGIEGARSGLVGEIFRLLRTDPKPWVLLENVPFMLQLSKGRAMEVIITALEELGYRWAYRVVNSRSFGLPQRRERVILLASLDGDPRDVLFADEASEPKESGDPLGRIACGFYWTEGTRGLGWAVDSVPTLKGGSTLGIPSPPAIVMPSGEIVTPDIRDAERLQGFEIDWTAPSSEVVKHGHRWKLVGNAVTVDVAAWVGRRLREPSKTGRCIQGGPILPGVSWPKAAWNVGEGRFSANISTFPAQIQGLPLHEFLQFKPWPLSHKATAGFLSRAEASSLHFPKGFLRRLRKHLQMLTSFPRANPRKRLSTIGVTA
jgi:DNA (cytosine-5)-methyltransferase 1